MSQEGRSRSSISNSSIDSDSIEIPPIEDNSHQAKRLNPEPFVATRLRSSDYASFFNLFVLTSYIISDMRKKPKSYFIGIFTVTLTITFVIILYSIMDMLPLVFLKQAQNTIGESDFVYRAKAAENISESANNYMYQYNDLAKRNEPASNSSAFVNCSNIEYLTQNFSKYDGVAPRWFAVGDFSNQNDSSVSTSGIIMILDTEKEVKIGLGRDFTKTLLGASQAFVTKSALKYLGLEANNQDTITINIDLMQLLTIVAEVSDPLTIDDVDTLVQLLNLNISRDDQLNLTVSDFFNITEIEGKNSF